jgi:hypothetical protein
VQKKHLDSSGRRFFFFVISFFERLGTSWDWPLIPFGGWPAILAELAAFGAQRRWSKIILSKVAIRGK